MKLLPEEEAKVLSKPTLIYIGQREKLLCRGRLAPKYWDKKAKLSYLDYPGPQRGSPQEWTG